jgi:hypothetical protein
MNQPNLLSNLLTEGELAKELRVSDATLVSWRQKRIGPAYTKLGKRVFYRRESVAAWIAANEKPTREGGRRARVRS